jgi:phosphoglycolate phosphatase
MRLILFDIDGTLMDTGGAGTRSLNLAMHELFSVQDAFHGIRMAGKTDTQIIKEGLRKNALPLDGTIAAVIDAYLRNLRREIQNDRKSLKPGIFELLRDLHLVGESALGLLTGNIEQGARIKLEAFHLNDYFPSGAFGSDSEDRNMLLPIAVKRFENFSGKRIPHDECIIVGDTPRDIECAKAHGAKSVGVATGPYPLEALVEAGADHALSDLSDHRAVLELLVTIS